MKKNCKHEGMEPGKKERMEEAMFGKATKKPAGKAKPKKK
jgi:hypothetical protein